MKRLVKLAWVWMCVGGIASAASAAVSVNPIFGDHMVLQQGRPLPVWGTASAGESITVRLGTNEATTTTDAKGHWKVELPAMKVGEPLEMTIRGANTITLRDILIGEVWVCSGQSNMAWTVSRSQHSEKEIREANHPKIRLFQVKRAGTPEPQSHVDGEWQVCSPETVPNFSGVGYFFGRHLQQELDVPIGLIDSSVGGTPAEAWTPRETLEADPDLKGVFAMWERRLKAAEAAEAKAAGDKPPTATRPRPRGKRAASQPAQPAPRGPSAAEIRTGKQRATFLYNAMIHPLIPYAIRGAIWYQGEGNAHMAYTYRKLFPAMIQSWRERWGQGDFPFLFVQLAPFGAPYKPDYSSGWAELREAQLMTLSLPATGMAVITDIGDPKDIHPINKQDVGKRLALIALANTYGKKVPYSGPMYDAMKVEGDRVRLSFKHTDGGLKIGNGETLVGFAVAGEDKRYHRANATIDGETVVVHSPAVPKPVAVRYGWADAPECNLANGAGLQASPFRTDDWPGVTAGRTYE